MAVWTRTYKNSFIVLKISYYNLSHVGYGSEIAVPGDITEDFAAGKIDEDHHPDPDGAIVDTDDPFGTFHPAAVSLGPVIVLQGGRD